MGRVGRWLVVGLVAVAVFALTIWVAQVLILPHFVDDDADRWVVSAAAATVTGALVGVWADKWVAPTGEGASPTLAAPPASPTPPSGKSLNVEGDVSGIAAVGDRTVNVQHRQAGGVEVGGDVSGIVAVGDDTSNSQLP